MLILVRIILNASLLKSLKPAQSLSSCLPGTHHHNHLATSFQPVATCERIIDKIDAENFELYLMGDLNCNLLPEVVSNNSSHLLNINDIYGLTQLITEPTRVKQYSSTLIDLCLTNSLHKISKSGVINIGISDRSAIYLTRKVTHLPSNMYKTVGNRQFKNFNEAEFFARLTGTALQRAITQMKCGTLETSFSECYC